MTEEWQSLKMPFDLSTLGFIRSFSRICIYLEGNMVLLATQYNVVEIFLWSVHVSELCGPNCCYQGNNYHYLRMWKYWVTLWDVLFIETWIFIFNEPVFVCVCVCGGMCWSACVCLSVCMFGGGGGGEWEIGLGVGGGDVPMVTGNHCIQSPPPPPPLNLLIPLIIYKLERTHEH